MWNNDAAHELVLYAENDYGLYQMRKPYLDNMRKKMAKGTYNVDLGIKLWMYYVERAAKAYVREHGSMADKWSKMFPPKARREAAEHFEQAARAEIRESGGARDKSRSRSRSRRGSVKVRSYKVKGYSRKRPAKKRAARRRK